MTHLTIGAVAARRLTLALFAAVLLAVAALAAPGVAHSATGSFCSGSGSGVLIDSGHTCVHGRGHTLTHVSGYSTGSAKACVGSKYSSSPSSGNYVYWGNFCAAYGGSTASTYYFSSCNPVTRSYADIHNHSGFLSRFKGNFEYGYC